MTDNWKPPVLELGEVEAVAADGTEGICYDEAIIFFKNEDCEESIDVECPGALRVAAFIVKAVNNHQPMVDAICGYLETFDRCGGSESVSAEEFAECRQRLRDAVGGSRNG